tara:strand:- start:2166 stop:2399 length:234 start_codon:yes stop_codon:yes gene_type:complete
MKKTKVRPVKKLRFSQAEALDISREALVKNTELKKKYHKVKTYDLDRHLRKLETLTIDVENALIDFYNKGKKAGRLG